MNHREDIPGRDRPPMTREEFMLYAGAFLAGFGACSALVIIWLASLAIGARA